MNREEFKKRTRKFALRVMRLVEKLPKNKTAATIGQQLFRSAASVGANYRAACRGRSRAEFVAKLGIVEEEADECAYWIELLIEGKVMRASLLNDLLKEADEIVALVVASIKTARRQRK